MQSTRTSGSTGAQRDTAVEALCRELEGLPLAIELAAAHAASLPATALLARIAGHSLDLLKADYHDAPERHRALRSTIRCTYELLDEENAQRLFRHLTVTGGSFDLDDAQALAGDAAFDALGALVDLHLVDPDTDVSSTSYRMPDSIRGSRPATARGRGRRGGGGDRMVAVIRRAGPRGDHRHRHLG